MLNEAIMQTLAKNETISGPVRYPSNHRTSGEVSQYFKYSLLSGKLSDKST